MTPERFQQIRALFHECCKLDAAARTEWLARECANDAALRAEVEELLVADQDTARSPTTPPRALAQRLLTDLSGADAGAPESFGRYRVLRKLGEGGMGAVYEAEQENPHRTVALKAIRPGLLSDALLRRFEYEVEILAQLQHPGIAAIYDAGVAEVVFPGGLRLRQPFFAMEYVAGRTLDEWILDFGFWILDSERPAKGSASSRFQSKIQIPKSKIETVLRLFVEICDAVHYAHQKGVIHRDLKPANILVDANGQPKIVDFGVARATDGDLQLTTPLTHSGQLIGTPAYMSPEQVRGNARQIDTRTDIYSLGVILYELFAGRPPLDLRATSLAEAVRRIAESEPAPLGRLNPALRGDISAIVAKALEKDKTRRYASAAELGEDIRRHLRNEPILARPISLTYLLGKFVRRHRAPVAGVIAAALAVVGGLSYGLIEARAERARALQAETQAKQQRDAADEARAKAVAERQAANKARDEALAARDESTAMFDFLSDTLSAADPRKLGRETTVREALDSAVAKLDTAFADRPQLKVHLQAIIGGVYFQLGALPAAEKQLSQALEVYRRNPGQAKTDTLTWMTTLASVYVAQGRAAPAEALLREALELARRLPDAEPYVPAGIVVNLAQLYLATDRYAEAEPLFQEVLPIIVREKGANHPETLAAKNSLANVWLWTGQYDRAETLLLELRQIMESTYGDNSPYTAHIWISLSTLYQRNGQNEKAESALLRVIDLAGRVWGADSLDRLTALINLGQLRTSIGRAAQGEPPLREALEIAARTLPPQHHVLGVVRGALAQCLANQQRYEEALPLMRAAHETLLAVLGPADEQTRIAAARVAEFHEKLGQTEAALEWRAKPTTSQPATPP